MISCSTHAGGREANEDSFAVLAGDTAPCGTLGLVAVADGIGGLGTGSQASSLAVKSLADVFCASCAVARSARLEVPNLLRFSLQKANAAVYQAGARDTRLFGMGCACVAAVFTKDKLHLVSIGDSRAYLHRGSKLISLTSDDWVKRQDGVTLVSRAMGWQPLLPIEPVSYDLRAGDRIILCTDGLTDALSEDTILSILAFCEDESAPEALVRAAASVPFADNVTVVSARFSR